MADLGNIGVGSTSTGKAATIVATGGVKKIRDMLRSVLYVGGATNRTRHHSYVVSNSGVINRAILGLRKLPDYLPAGVSTLSADLSGSIFGVVKVEGVATAGRIVRLYARPNGKLVKETVSEVNGEFTVIDLYVGMTYYVIALDDDGGADYNAVIFDKLVPTVS